MDFKANQRYLFRIVSLILFTFLLGACGGGGSGSNDEVSIKKLPLSERNVANETEMLLSLDGYEKCSDDDNGEFFTSLRLNVNYAEKYVEYDGELFQLLESNGFFSFALQIDQTYESTTGLIEYRIDGSNQITGNLKNGKTKGKGYSCTLTAVVEGYSLKGPDDYQNNSGSTGGSGSGNETVTASLKLVTNKGTFNGSGLEAERTSKSGVEGIIVNGKISSSIFSGDIEIAFSATTNGTHTFSCNGADSYIAIYDPAGNYVYWADEDGGSCDLSVIVDDSGVRGNFTATLVDDEGDFVTVSSGQITMPLESNDGSNLDQNGEGEIDGIGLRSSYVVNAKVYTSPSVPQTLTSYFGGQSNTVHFSWVEPYSENDKNYFAINYGTWNKDQGFTTQKINHTKFQATTVKMAVDGSDKPHFAFWGRLDSADSYLFKSGNFGIYYAGSDLNAVKVSAGQENKNENIDSLYNAHSSGKPTIFLDSSGSPHIMYVAGTNSLNSYKKNLVLASKSTGWSQQAFYNDISNVNGVNKTFSLTDIQTSLHNSTIGSFVFQDISNYDVHLFSPNKVSSITDYGYSVKDTQMLEDGQGKQYAVWRRTVSEDTSKGRAADYAFYIAEIKSDGTFATPIRVPQHKDISGGNFAPAAIDPITGYFYFMYFDGGLGVSISSHVMVYNPALSKVKYFEIPKELGAPSGQGSLWAYNNQLTYVAPVKNKETEQAQIKLTVWSDIDFDWD